jgi:hypothetical protein
MSRKIPVCLRKLQQGKRKVNFLCFLPVIALPVCNKTIYPYMQLYHFSPVFSTEKENK